jgi:hypothetical protein
MLYNYNDHIFGRAFARRVEVEMISRSPNMHWEGMAEGPWRDIAAVGDFASSHNE